MKILASGDHHWDEHKRFDECQRVHGWMVDLAREHDVDLFLSGGDVYERASTPVEREAVAEWLTEMAEVSPVLVTKGNHDRRRDCAILARLRTYYPVIVEETAAVHHIAGAAVAAVAWPDRAHLLAAGVAGEAADAAVQDALRNVLRGLGEQLNNFNGPRILLGHFMCDGAETSTGQPLLGQPIRVGLADLALARAHLVLMSHIHMAQGWDCDGAPARYMGSPFRTDFGQLERKTVLLAEFDGPRLVSVEEVETPATPMVHIESSWLPPDVALPMHAQALPATVVGAEVRLRYTTPSDQREAARADASTLRDRIIEAGALSVKMEEVVQTQTRARVPEVAAAKTITDKLDAYWRAVGFEPSERRASLTAKATELEEATHAA